MSSSTPRPTMCRTLAASPCAVPSGLRGGLRDQFGRQVVEHPALVVLAPAPPVAVLAPLPRRRPRRRFAGQLVVERIFRRLLGAGHGDRQEEPRRRGYKADDKNRRLLHRLFLPNVLPRFWTRAEVRPDCDSSLRLDRSCSGRGDMVKEARREPGTDGAIVFGKL